LKQLWPHPLPPAKIPIANSATIETNQGEYKHKIKRKVSRDFLPVYLIKIPTLGLCFMPQSVLAYNFKFAELFEFEV
jgi:hypothetical protein